MGKRFKTNNYSEAILDSWNDFRYFNCKINEFSEKPQLHFNWRFKQYEGSGTIYFTEAHILRNKFGDNDSYLSLSSACRDKHIGLKPTDSLYNDPGLSVIFQRVLDSYFISCDQGSC